jgi:uncharacterized protein
MLRADDQSFADAHAALLSWIERQGSLLVGLSGGVDSAFLAVTARDVVGRSNVLAVLGASDAVPAGLRQRAAECARMFDILYREIPTHELDDSDYVANRGNRCYFCKRELWSRLVPIAREAGLATIADGTLRDDLAEHRPGLAAGREVRVASPLAECGFTKTQVRAAARARGIPFWDAPASPCLASRVTTNVQVTSSRLARIERAELQLRALGVTGDLRVRDLGDAARVELPPEDLARWLEPAAQARVADAVRGAGYTNVTVDPRGYRRGALQERGPEPGDGSRSPGGTGPLVHA